MLAIRQRYERDKYMIKAGREEVSSSWIEDVMVNGIVVVVDVEIQS